MTVNGHSTPSIQTTSRFAPEFQLALACIRWPLSTYDREDILALATAPLDWLWFIRIVRNHQILPLVYRNLREAAAGSMPCDAASTLHSEAMLNARRSLSQAAELVRIVSLLEQAGLGVTTLKGVPLSILAFDDPAMRSCLDIDLLIAPADIFEAERVLLEAGYHKTVPKDLTPKRLKYYLRYYKDFTYYSNTSGLSIELHWRLFKSAEMPMQSSNDPPSTLPVNLGSQAVEALSGHDLFLYLCVHGAIHAWALLKWLADVGALLNKMTAQGLEEMTARASALEVSAELSAALILLKRLLGLDRSCEGLLRESNPAVRRIVNFSMTRLTANDYCDTLQDAPGIRSFVYTLFLRPSWSYRSGCLIDNAILPKDWELINLPDMLFPLYLGVRPVSWLMRRQFARVSEPEQSKP